MGVIWVMTALTAACVALFAVRVAIFLRCCPRLLPTNAAPADAPPVSIIVPARNEAANIERCVYALLAQTYPRFEVVVVDDSSTDDTPAILARLAADARLQVAQAGPLPRGWVGKNHAIAEGERRARGEWLLFVDADVDLHPSALSAAYGAARQRGADMLSLWARQELVGFWERAFLPVLIGLNLAMDPLQRSSSPRHPDVAPANGQFILVDRGVYQQIGGHAAVCGEVVEDQMLARRLKRAGYRLLMLDGTPLLRTRMYASLAQVWEGSSKNNFLMLRRSLLLVALGVLAVALLTISPFALSAGALVLLPSSRDMLGPLLANLALVAALLLTRWRARRFFPTPLRDYLLAPLGGLLFIAIILNSAYQHIWGGGAVWKGRRYEDVDPAA